MAEQKEKRVIEENTEKLVRILGQDIRGSRNLQSGFAKIKGVSWAISNIACKRLSLDRNSEIGDLTKEDIKKIEDFLKELEAPEFMKNRRSDPETGESKHLLSTDLDMRKEFDIKRLKQIKSYKGVRHSLRLPVRGQRTRSHFRRSGVAVGVKKPKQGKKS